MKITLIVDFEQDTEISMANSFNKEFIELVSRSKALDSLTITVIDENGRKQTLHGSDIRPAGSSLN